MSGHSGTLYTRLAVELLCEIPLICQKRTDATGLEGHKAVLRRLGSQDANISRAEKDISLLDRLRRTIVSEDFLDADIPSASSNTIKTLGYRNFSKGSFRSYRKWGNVPVAVQVRMCEYLEMEFPVLYMVRSQCASVAFFSAYFRRGYNVPIDNNCPSSQEVPIFDREEQDCDVPAETDDADFTADSSGNQTAEENSSEEEPVQPPAASASSGDKRKISETRNTRESRAHMHQIEETKRKAKLATRRLKTTICWTRDHLLIR
ncbi:hypothetical protein V1504DRAFT_459783 [Lipomyces starkeyi]